MPETLAKLWAALDMHKCVVDTIRAHLLLLFAAGSRLLQHPVPTRRLPSLA
jgi:hypothetical protein